MKARSIPLILVLSHAALPVARKLQQVSGGEIVGPQGRVETGRGGVNRTVANIGDAIRAAFNAGRAIFGVMASGSLIRILAGNLKDKQSEPAVIAISEDGASVVPLLGGHHGANDLARELARMLDGHAAITTSGDIRFGIALDAPPPGWRLANPQDAKQVMADLLAGASLRLEGDAASIAGWLDESGLEFSADGKLALMVTERQVEAIPGVLVYHPVRHVLGIGCERGASVSEAIDLAERDLADAGLSPDVVAGISSIDVKADEAAIHAVAGHFGVPLRLFPASLLEAETPRTATPSEIVFKEVGTHGVAENSALALAGKESWLAVPKRKSKRVTAAVACAPQLLKETDIMETGRARGTLFVVGIGPGQEGWRSPEVSRMIGEASDLVGYSLYLDLVADISAGKTRHDYDLGKEEDRVRHAMELAGEGREVALVCSGDAGIYAMATLVFELLEKGNLSDSAKRIGIAVSPGISALQAAAARAGAPLGHDFCTISLSDLLTPWGAIQKRVKAAAEGDFVIAFYNPVSKRRRTQLSYARDVLLEHRPADTPVILASNLGRPEEKVRVVPLSGLQVDDVDMLTVVVVGSSETRTVTTCDGRTWVYTPRGYAAKEGTGISA